MVAYFHVPEMRTTFTALNEAESKQAKQMGAVEVTEFVHDYIRNAYQQGFRMYDFRGMNK